MKWEDLPVAAYKMPDGSTYFQTKDRPTPVVEWMNRRYGDPPVVNGIVQHHIARWDDGPALKAITRKEGEMSDSEIDDAEEVLNFRLRREDERVDGLHEQMLAHGDAEPILGEESRGVTKGLVGRPGLSWRPWPEAIFPEELREACGWLSDAPPPATPDGDAGHPTGAVRSADSDHLDFTSLPLLGLIGVARTAAEGGFYYGRHNYQFGFPVHDLLNHAMKHLTMWLLGDRSEPHLEHAAWGILAAIESKVLFPELNEEYLLGPGATLTDAMKRRLEREAPVLAERRKSRGDESWDFADLAEVKKILTQREEMR